MLIDFLSCSTVPSVLCSGRYVLFSVFVTSSNFPGQSFIFTHTASSSFSLSTCHFCICWCSTRKRCKMLGLAAVLLVRLLPSHAVALAFVQHWNLLKQVSLTYDFKCLFTNLWPKQSCELMCFSQESREIVDSLFTLLTLFWITHCCSLLEGCQGLKQNQTSEVDIWFQQAQ